MFPDRIELNGWNAEAGVTERDDSVGDSRNARRERTGRRYRRRPPTRDRHRRRGRRLEPHLRVRGLRSGCSPAQALDPVTFPATDLSSAALVDLSSDGIVELVVTHGESMFTPDPLELPDGTVGPTPEAESTGYLTVFELREGLPGGEIDLGDLDSLTELTYPPHRSPDSLDSDPSTRIESADLDNDGRPDLVAETLDGLELYRNQSSNDSPFSFRRVGVLTGAGESVYRPTAWTLGDVDSDHDVDVVSFSNDGAQLAREPAAVRWSRPGVAARAALRDGDAVELRRAGERPVWRSNPADESRRR